ncbi:coiled-coil domain-containing protein 96 [Clupea harengus]|uniref:Coiled-coil domain-containing protein 96 n=1 Tax=Clupea harengus TaxID=7950 RepID=A0A6P8GS39_CLUHA|nr:coiled-coil domain-containing protein 96 [Clupea harengus]
MEEEEAEVKIEHGTAGETHGDLNNDGNAPPDAVEASDENSGGEKENEHEHAEKQQGTVKDHNQSQQIKGEGEEPTAEEDSAEVQKGMGEESMGGDVNAGLPTSETFEEGEGDEMEPLIGEPLSREGSIKGEYDDITDDEKGPPRIDPGTPERSSSGSKIPEQVEEKEVEVEDDSGIDYMEILKELQNEKERLCQHNVQLQFKLVEYFRRKTGDEAKPERERDKAVSDQEQRFVKYIDIMEDLKNQYRRDSELHQQQAEVMRQQMQVKLEQVEREWRVFMEQKNEVAVSVLRRRLGKQEAQAEVEQIQTAEQRRENELVAVRLENIKLKNKTRKFEAALRAKEELAAGLHLIDFEQLKIENQTYNEKIEERNEELLKLRKKITSTVQVLTHVKEKLQFVQVENQSKRVQLAEVDTLVAQKRDTLTRTKQARDNLRMDNLRLRQSCGLLGNETLLRDFEEKVDASDALEQKLEMLKRRHAELILKCAGVKKKLEQTKPSPAQTAENEHMLNTIV